MSFPAPWSSGKDVALSRRRPKSEPARCSRRHCEEWATSVLLGSWRHGLNTYRPYCPQHRRLLRGFLPWGIAWIAPKYWRSLVDAQVPQLRKPRFGGWTVEKRHRGERAAGHWEYRLSKLAVSP